MLSDDHNYYNKMKYNKDYSSKTAKEWLADRKWTAFFMQVPIGKPQPFIVNDANDINSLRSTASMLNKDADCDRTFDVSVDFTNGAIAVTAKMK